MNLQDEATKAIRDADFRSSWPLDARYALVKAAKTEGEMPGYAVKEVRWALKTVRAIENRLAKDIAAGEATLSQVDKRRLGV